MQLRGATLLLAVSLGFGPGVASGQLLLDRLYNLGDSPDGEGASNGTPVANSLFGISFDDANLATAAEAVDLSPAAGSPTYTSIIGRPDGQGGLGVRFDGDDALAGARLGLPDTTVTSVEANNYDFSGLANRGLQLWVNVDPFASTGLQTIVADTNQHGVQINDSGNLAMLYAGESFDSGVSAAGGGWFHVMVVRPEGAGGGSRMYVNGDAVSVAAGGYDGADDADLVIGASTATTGEPELGAQGDFFSGVVDELKMFVIGDVTSAPDPSTGAGPLNFGSQTVRAFESVFDIGIDNDYITFKRTEATGTAVPGDLNLDGSFDGHLPGGADRVAFLNGWFDRNEIDGVTLGDLGSFQSGDLNFDGLTDLVDLVEFQGLIAAQPSGVVISSAELVGIPEPASVMMVLVSAFGLAGRRR